MSETTYDWDLDGNGTFEVSTGGNSSAITTSYDSVGTRNVKVRVRDTHGLSAVAAVHVVVHTGDHGTGPFGDR